MLPARRYASVVGPSAMTACLSQTRIVSKRLDGSSWFFAKMTVAYNPLKLSEILDVKFRHGTSIVATSTRCQLSPTKMDVQNWKSSVELN